ncbi:MAG TPA: MJ0042-type zinc finger domain-containing protein [Arenibaculum sp.]|nr:MJ0042-type zinc finger domain-containing protein [Arenibaculum sp.]
MILTCPACSTRYVVDPSALGSDGRLVRCAKCGNSWMQQPPVDMARPVDAASPLDAPPEALPEEARPLAPGSNLPALPRRRSRRTAVWWLAGAVLVGGLAAGAVFSREEVVAAWPAAARLYDTIGMPVEAVGAGLQLRNVRSERRVEEGGTILFIQGQITNVSDRHRPVPALRAVALDGQRRQLRQWSITASHGDLVPGDVATFESILRDPDPQISEVAITFDGG